MSPNVDHYNRRITYLRVSVTDRCNLRCIYCRPVNELKLLDHANILSYEEILKVIQAATELGMKKVRLTGGEPLVRKNFVHFVASVCRIPQIEDISVSTNGVLLKKMALPLFEAGIRRINVSLDTLNPRKYAMITGLIALMMSGKDFKQPRPLGFRPSS